MTLIWPMNITYLYKNIMENSVCTFHQVHPLIFVRKTKTFICRKDPRWSAVLLFADRRRFCRLIVWNERGEI